MNTSPTLQIQFDLPVKYDVEIFIAGGGPSGVAAAVTAARMGRKVFLAEGHSCFGGMGTAGLVPVFLYFGDGVNFLAGGVGQEVYQLLKQRTPRLYLDEPLAGTVGVDAEILKRIYDDMMTGCGAAFSFQTHLIGVQAANGRVQYAICAAKSGLFAVKADLFIDATGDGDLAAWAGASFEKGDLNHDLMPGSLCSLWADIDWEKGRDNPSHEHYLEQAYAEGVFSVLDRHLPGIYQVGEHLGGGNLVHTFGVDGTDEVSLTQALLGGRKGMEEYQMYYRTYYQGFDKMTLVATGSLLGIRETRRILGDYVLCLDDFKNCSVFEDEIGRFAYPVDVHEARPDAESHQQFAEEFKRLRYPPGKSYGIPFRTLTPRGLDNVLAAGRCISADRYIQGSVRVSSGCFITGQAAGAAAALACETKLWPRQVDVQELQRRLKGNGAFLPNAR